LSEIKAKKFFDVRSAIDWFVKHVVDLLNLEMEQVVQHHVPLHVVESHVILNHCSLENSDIIGLSLYNEVLGDHVKLGNHKGLESEGRCFGAVWHSSYKLNGHLKVVTFSNHKAFGLSKVNNISISLSN